MAYQGQQHHGQATNRVDEYGNPVVVPGGGMGAHGGVGTGTGGHVQPIKGERKARGILHRSGSSSSSSSSSEDDGMGGRRSRRSSPVATRTSSMPRRPAAPTVSRVTLGRPAPGCMAPPRPVAPTDSRVTLG